MHEYAVRGRSYKPKHLCFYIQIWTKGKDGAVKPV